MLRTLHTAAFQSDGFSARGAQRSLVVRWLLAVKTNNARQVSLESLSVVNNGPRYEEGVVSRIREYTRSRTGAFHLGERQVGCVQNAEIIYHQCALPGYDGELARVGKVRGWFDPRHAGRRSHAHGDETSVSIEQASAADGASGAEPYRAIAILRGEDAVNVPLTDRQRS